MTTVIYIIAALLTVYYVIDFFFFHNLSDGPAGVKKALMAPIYYFFGYECDICHKVYLFDSHKAFMCCPGPHNNYGHWTKEWGKKNGGKNNQGLGFPTHTCSHCGGTGQINGVACGWCDGLGKTYFDI